MNISRVTLTTRPSEDYELLDSGKEEKLERYGDVVLARPDPQALWEKNLPGTAWKAAQGRYTREGREGVWELASGIKNAWEVNFGGLTLTVKPTSFKHTGIFPEQAPNWDWLRETISKAVGEGREVKVLNLFAYTGGASLAAAQAGAHVTHVDASKTAVAWARENAEKSGLKDKPIRWIVEDVLLFVKREGKRGNKYDLIVMDPPAFGHGPSDELWKIEEHLLELMALCKDILSESPLGVLMSGYAAGYSPLVFAYNLEPLATQYGGSLECGELTIEEKGNGRLLPCGMFARWRTI